MAATVVPTILNHKNYDDWSFRVKTYLLAEDLWDVLDGGTDESPKTTDEESKAWKKKDAKILCAIQNSCGDDTYQFIKDETTAKGAWYTLSKKLKKLDDPPDDKDEMLVPEAYPPPTDHDATLEEGHTGGHDEGNAKSIHETFVEYVKSDDWDNAIKFLREHRQAGSAIFPLGGGGGTEHFLFRGTVLHYALQNFKSCSTRIIQQLVALMANKDLELQDSFDFTALCYIISYCPERVDLAECMVKKNHNLLTILPPSWEKEPLVVVAQGKTKGERMARYLYSLTCEETITLKVSDAAQLISLGFRLQRFDIAWDLIQRYPELAMANDHDRNIPLVTLASNRFAFLSGRRLNLWRKLIYYGICIKPLPIGVNVRKSESDHSDQRPPSDQKENQGDLISSGINDIYLMKLTHERVKQFLPVMCKVASAGGMSYYKRMKLEEALCVAAERGHVEYITNFLRDSSYSAESVFEIRNKKCQTLFQIATECRHHKVYNLIYVLDQMCKKEIILGPDQSDEIHKRVGKTDDFGNNLLHTVASITPLSHIDHIQGAALQMQRELQWFKEVESVADPKHSESVNKDNKTPREVFKENHKELAKEAEKSMKETATSCTVVGALIVTIMFAAAFTVPGGNDEKASIPKLFTTFIVSDAISLFSSTTSVIMFLGILTSRYSQDDFHKSLPTKMIMGLFTLFLSIATMMIVFSCGLYIILDGKSSLVIPSILLAGVPIASFIWMQFPLLKDLSISTFGWGIFDRKQKNLF